MYTCDLQVYPIAPSLRRGVLMSDFNDANIICDAQDAEEIVGVSRLVISGRDV